MKLLTALFLLVLALAATDADAARRLGGGKSIGKQSSNVTQREAQPAPAAPAATPQRSPAPAGAATPPTSRPWAGMLGGLAAGLGLAWLAHSLGLGAGFGNVLMLLLLAGLAFAVIGMLMRRRAVPAGPQGERFSFPAGPAPAEAPPPPQYNPAKIGNDASARPWERNSMAFEPAKVAGAGSGLRIGSALEGAQGWGVPAGFDTEGFVAAAKRNFVTLQDAWDRSDLATLRSMMTDEMLGEIRNQLAERDRGAATGQGNRTEVVMLEASLLGIEDLGDAYLASVEFSGLIREDASAGPTPFREVWNMTKPRNGSAGWLVAGLQALQ